ncbi:hypothetical protein Tco_1050472 [Tanacetum coccineum]
MEELQDHRSIFSLARYPGHVIRLTFVMPSRMCINPMHNNKGILHHSENVTSEEMWAASSCAMDSLYDLDLISSKVPVVLDNSKTWFRAMSTGMKLGSRGVAHVEGVSRADLKEKSQYSKILLINRTASHLSWFMECKDRKNRSSVLLPHSFLPSMAAKKLRDAAQKCLVSSFTCGMKSGCRYWSGRMNVEVVMGEVECSGGDCVRERQQGLGISSALE